MKLLKRFNFRSIYMKKITKHGIIPAIITTIFFVVASMPTELLGFYIRLQIAALLAIAAGTLSIVAVMRTRMG